MSLCRAVTWSLFVTSADRPIAESERQFLERIRAWGKKVVMTLNKIDILQDQETETQVKDFVLQAAVKELGFAPEFFPVSARLAQAAQTEPDPEKSAQIRQASRLDPLVDYIQVALDDTARLRLKLASPLGVAGHLIDQAQTSLSAQAAGLKEDKQAVSAIESVIAGYEMELQNELAPRLSEVDNILGRLEARGLDFFDSTLRLTKIADLARGERVRAQFEKQVLADVPQQIENNVQRLIDWLVEKDLRQWQQVVGYLQRRQEHLAEPFVAVGTATLDVRRRALIESVGKTAQTIIDTYDREAEARVLAAEVEKSVAEVALLEAGAVGLGALVAFAITSSALDITGILAAGTLAIVGFFVIPFKRRQAKERFQEKMQALREKLHAALTAQFDQEADSSITRMKEGVAPYTRFVHGETERVDRSLSKLEQLQQRVTELSARVERIE